MVETILYPTKTKANKVHKCMFCCQPIAKGSVYLKSTHKFDGDVYAWKTHEHCSEIASKLKMYEHADEGVTTEDFIESINGEYQTIMSETQNELYDSKTFVYPKFLERLLFVLNHHGVSAGNGA